MWISKYSYNGEMEDNVKLYFMEETNSTEKCDIYFMNLFVFIEFQFEISVCIFFLSFTDKKGQAVKT
jgi:hypothetical protein